MSSPKLITDFVNTECTRSICRTYGDRFERLDPAERFELIGILGIWMSALMEEEATSFFPWTDLPISEAPTSDVAYILDRIQVANNMGPSACSHFIAGISQTLHRVE